MRLQTAVVEFLKVWGLVGLLVAAGFIVTYQYIGAPPPQVIAIATGMSDGAYYAFGQQYARLLARDGITLEVIPTAGSVENLELLRTGKVSLALVQGGAATSTDRENLQSLGSLFLEPVWVFTQSGSTIHRLSDLNGKRVAVGAKGSGTNLLSTQLLAANGITESDAELIRTDTAEAARAMLADDIDAAIFVASLEAPVIQDLLREPEVELLDVARNTAYAQLFPSLNPITLSEGVLDLQHNTPAHDTRLVAASASLAARSDLHVALIPALLDAVTRVHESGGVLEGKERFPSAEFVDLPLNEDAARYIRNGPSFLYRWLPYGTAVLMDRLKLLVLPLIALVIPLFRIAPPLYQWRIRSKIYRWYAAVREIDTLLLSGTPDDVNAISNRLQELEREIASVSVPLAYAGEQYHLRLHLRLLQDRLETRTGTRLANTS
jgi:TRAP transporter TAXI family solute receptor